MGLAAQLGLHSWDVPDNPRRTEKTSWYSFSTVSGKVDDFASRMDMHNSRGSFLGFRL